MATNEDIHRAIGRMEAKLDSALESIDNHGPRITSLETDRTRFYTITGVFSAIGAFVAWLVGFAK